MCEATSAFRMVFRRTNFFTNDVLKWKIAQDGSCPFVRLYSKVSATSSPCLPAPSSVASYHRPSCHCLRLQQSCSFSTADIHCIKSSQEPQKKTGLLSKVKWDFGFITGLKYPKAVLNMSGFRMYICCTEMVDHAHFFTELDLPDTFNSWFLVTDLHIWLCMVRLASLGKDGRLVRNCLVKALWEDVEARSKQLGNAATLTARREGVRQMADLFHASLFGLDEGLLGSDRELAGAVWRLLLEMRKDAEPHHLELLVSYIRKQVAHLDGQDDATILRKGLVTFLPLSGDAVNQATLQRLTIDRLM